MAKKSRTAKRNPVAADPEATIDLSGRFTRREFVHYSTFALAAVATGPSLLGCGGGGGGGGGGEDSNLVFGAARVETGEALRIETGDSPGLGSIPADVFHVVFEVDGETLYGLRPILFRDQTIAVLIPPMIGSDGVYFESKTVQVRATVRGQSIGSGVVEVVQPTVPAGTRDALLTLLGDLKVELDGIEADKGALCQEPDLLATWDELYPGTRGGLDWLASDFGGLTPSGEITITAADGSQYRVTAADLDRAALMIGAGGAGRLAPARSPAAASGELGNKFLDSLPEPTASVARGLTALLSYALPSALVLSSAEDRGGTAPAGVGAVVAILGVLVPAACMCVAGGCLRKTEGDADADQWIEDGLRWYAQLLINLGLGGLSKRMLCDVFGSPDLAVDLVTEGCIDLLEYTNANRWIGLDWSNTPWANHSTWSNNDFWTNAAWTNQPWSHTPWNNIAPWSHNPWDNL